MASGGAQHVRRSWLFRVMCDIEARLHVSCFSVMDENFLLHKKRALELLDLMKAHGKSWSLYVFSSANALGKYDVRQLVELGISWAWLGLESPQGECLQVAWTARSFRDHGYDVKERLHLLEMEQKLPYVPIRPAPPPGATRRP